MLFFLSQRVERLRDAVNPDAGIVLVHHTKKLGKRQFEEDPFQALSGASSLRGYYSTGMLLFRSDETQTPRQLLFELRNGPASPPSTSTRSRATWREVTAGERLVRHEYGAKLDAERRRKRDVILQIIYDEAAKGRCYVATQFGDDLRESRWASAPTGRYANGSRCWPRRATSSSSAIPRRMAFPDARVVGKAISASRTCG
jgi:putative DNA primase/helicase